METQGLLVCPSLCKSVIFSLAKVAGEGISSMGLTKIARNGEKLPARQGCNAEPCCGHPARTHRPSPRDGGTTTPQNRDCWLNQLETGLVGWKVRHTQV